MGSISLGRLRVGWFRQPHGRHPDYVQLAGTTNYLSVRLRRVGLFAAWPIIRRRPRQNGKLSPESEAKLDAVLAAATAHAQGLVKSQGEATPTPPAPASASVRRMGDTPDTGDDDDGRRIH